MYEIVVVMVVGYLIGSINPAWIISRLKKIELRRKGTGNLGATNVFLTLGKRTGVFVMLFDIGKAYAVVLIAKTLFPQISLAGVLAGSAAMLGHMFPFYLGFKGGKGSACLGGAILGLDWKLFLALLMLGIVIALLVDYPWAVPVSAAGLFPFAFGVSAQSMISIGILICPSICIILKHMENYRRVREGTEPTIRGYLKGLKREKS
jgi:glycerol-3-phosphate acyltransferase PlsY